MTKDTVALKLAKLLEKARSAEEIGNAEEAAAFSAKAQELLVKHELTMSDVEYAAVQETDPIYQEYFRSTEHGLEGKRVRVKWQEDLAHVLSRAFFCKLLVVPGSNKLVFVGRNTHRQMLTYVYARLVRDVLRLQGVGYSAAWDAYREGGERDRSLYLGSKASFRRGFVEAIRKRLRKEQEERRAELEDTGDGTSLIRLDNAHRQVQEFIKRNVPTSRAGGLSGRSGHNHGGFRSGFDAGSKANLSANGINPTTGGSPKRLGSGR